MCHLCPTIDVDIRSPVNTSEELQQHPGGRGFEQGCWSPLACPRDCLSPLVCLVPVGCLVCPPVGRSPLGCPMVSLCCPPFREHFQVSFARILEVAEYKITSDPNSYWADVTLDVQWYINQTFSPLFYQTHNVLVNMCTSSFLSLLGPPVLSPDNLEQWNRLEQAQQESNISGASTGGHLSPSYRFHGFYFPRSPPWVHQLPAGIGKAEQWNKEQCVKFWWHAARKKPTCSVCPLGSEMTGMEMSWRVQRPLRGQYQTSLLPFIEGDGVV